MFDKNKIIIIVMIVITLGLGLVIVQISASAKKKISDITIERDTAKADNMNLSAKVAALDKDNKVLQEKITAVTKDVEKLGQEKQELQKAYETLTAEKADLQNQINQLNTQIAAQKEGSAVSAQQEEPAPAGNDAYWGQLLRKKEELQMQVADLRAQLQEYKLTNDKLVRDKKMLELEVDNVNRDENVAKREQDYNKKLADTLAQELAREKNDKFMLKDDVKSLKDENKYLRQQLKSIGDRKSDIETKLASLQSRNSELEANMAKMESFVREKLVQMDSLKQEMQSMKTLPGAQESMGIDVSAIAAQRSDRPSSGSRKGAVELQPIVIRPQQEQFEEELMQQPSGGGSGAIRPGHVLAVNSENNFVIINLGEAAGTQVGDKFTVTNSRNEQVAEIAVIQVRKDISAADIVNARRAIVVGDTVK